MFDDYVLNKLNIDNLSNKSDSTLIQSNISDSEKVTYSVFELRKEQIARFIS